MQTSGHSLISSTDVNGTAVYSPSGEHLGTIDHLMIEKVSGKVTYAVMAFGGFLGIGEDHYPIPWGKLSYDITQDGYVTDLTREQLEGAPQHSADWYRDRDWEERTHRHYGVHPYWM